MAGDHVDHHRFFAALFMRLSLRGDGLAKLLIFATLPESQRLA